MSSKTRTEFVSLAPTLDSSWRALILFGRNAATYKFALGLSILELGRAEQELVTLEELAVPFARHLCKHLVVVDRQALSSRSEFLDACRSYNSGSISHEQLINTTVRVGFRNVLDAYHVLDGRDIDHRFFVDERRSNGGIRLTAQLHELVAGAYESLSAETQSRWSLVEAAWELNVPQRLLTVRFDPPTLSLLAQDHRRRAPITGARGALSGYQKGSCFYCFSPISVDPANASLGQVDHVFPWSIGPTVGGAPIDGVWNLVLACARCNTGKSNRPPHPRYIERLNRRNEYLIASHHPLRPTLVAQTGATRKDRISTLRQALDEVTAGGVRMAWRAPDEYAPRF